MTGNYEQPNENFKKKPTPKTDFSLIIGKLN